jgi:hypothetical protein
VNGSLDAKRRTRATMIAVIVGLTLFVIDVFAFNGEDFTYVIAGVISAMMATKWLLAWTPLRVGERLLLAVLAIVPWMIAYADPYPSVRGAAVANIACFGLAILVQKSISGRV